MNNILRHDRVVSVLSKDGKFRVAAINNTRSAQTAAQKHKLDYLPAYFLARQLAAASMLAVFLKGEERISLEAAGAGPISRVFAEAIQVGEVRGFIDSDANLDLTKLQDISEAIGIGLYKVRRVLYDKPEPVLGVVELVKGNISSDLEYYFAQSEQIPTSVILESVFDENGNILASGGMIIQALPGVTEQEIMNLQNNFPEDFSLKSFLVDQIKPEEMLAQILPFEFDIIKNDRVDFFCRCSKDKFINKLVTLNLKEIQGMKNQGHNELVCLYCNSRYYLDNKDFDNLIEIVQSKQN